MTDGVNWLQCVGSNLSDLANFRDRQVTIYFVRDLRYLRHSDHLRLSSFLELWNVSIISNRRSLEALLAYSEFRKDLQIVIVLLFFHAISYILPLFAEIRNFSKFFFLPITRAVSLVMLAILLQEPSNASHNTLFYTNARSIAQPLLSLVYTEGPCHTATVLNLVPH